MSSSMCMYVCLCLCIDNIPYLHACSNTAVTTIVWYSYSFRTMKVMVWSMDHKKNTNCKTFFWTFSSSTSLTSPWELFNSTNAFKSCREYISKFPKGLPLEPNGRGKEKGKILHVPLLAKSTVHTYSIFGYIRIYDTICM